MGYYTSFSLYLESDPDHWEDEDKFGNNLIALAGPDYEYEIKQLLEGFGVYAKLYELDSWIASLAPKYPHLLICLCGDGEESGDYWEMRWRGKEVEMQEAIIPPFQNKNLLKKSELSKD